MHLTPTEWKILDVLLRRPGKLVSGDALLTAVRGSSEHTDPSYLRIYLAQLRRKLEPEPSRPAPPDHRAGHGLPLPPD